MEQISLLHVQQIHDDNFAEEKCEKNKRTYYPFDEQKHVWCSIPKFSTFFFYFGSNKFSCPKIVYVNDLFHS